MAVYFALPAFLAQALLQYLLLASKVVYGFLHTGHFFSMVTPRHNRPRINNKLSLLRGSYDYGIYHEINGFCGSLIGYVDPYSVKGLTA